MCRSRLARLIMIYVCLELGFVCNKMLVLIDLINMISTRSDLMLDYTFIHKLTTPLRYSTISSPPSLLSP